MSDHVMTLDEEIEEQLGKHIIPITPTMVHACKVAISLANQGKENERVKLPDDVILRDIETWEAQTTAPAFRIIEWCHLDKWVEKNVTLTSGCPVIIEGEIK